MQTRKKSTQTILPLSQDVIAKIAAGEVIERPAFAVKELVENALDAKASRLIIHIEEAGLKKITIIDNGKGMSKQDLLESFKLHTTSKLKHIDDLTTVATLGFRGEALASIAAISHLTIQSRTKNKVSGTKIEIVNGKLKKTAPVGMPPGTTVTVSNLFHAVPARKKFLKSIPTEFRHILSYLTHVAIAHPEVHLSLTHNQKTLFDLPKTTNVLERIEFFLGKKVFTHLLPLSYQDSYIKLSGFITKPQEASVIGKQYFFVNNRKVTDKLALGAVRDAYGTKLAKNTQPSVILFVSLPYEFVDVNVHPRKDYVRFADTKLLIEAIFKAVSQTLTQHDLSFTDDFGFASEDKSITNLVAGKILKEVTVPWDIRARDEIGEAETIQIHNLYLLTQTKFGLSLVDQHAAHERILYEQFLHEFKQKQQEQAIYHLPKSYILSLPFTESEILEEYLPFFQTLGFEIEKFKTNQYFVSAVPLLFQDRNPEELFSEFLKDLADGKKPKSLDEKSAKMIAFLACRGAIKAGEHLTKQQMKDLLHKLEITPNNSTCPHGRPTKILINIDTVHRMFKRK